MAQVTVDVNRVVGSVSPLLYGQMIEQAYWSVHLGLCTQMIDNGGFELDRDGIYRKVAQGWALFSTDPRNRYAARLDDQNTRVVGHAQLIEVSTYAGGEIRLIQRGLNVKSGVDYTGFVCLRGDVQGAVSVGLLSTGNEVLAATELGAIKNTSWQKREFVLKASADCQDAAFAVIIKGTGTLWLDQLMLYPGDSYQGHGTRADMVELYKGLRPPFLRWPGGTYLIWHYWKNGIGPLEDRPCLDGRRLGGGGRVVHDGEWEPNTFGTDEFIQLCRDVDSEPMINVNIKDGLQNTLDWIEYCNGDVTTTWGAQRAKNGHPEPYNVKYWVVDNEPMAGTERKAFSLETFPMLSRVWAEAMKKKDPSLTVLVMGDHAIMLHLDALSEFNTRVVKETSAVLDALCIHCYYDQTHYAPLQGTPYEVGRVIDELKQVIGQHCGGRAVKVALTEWNPQSYCIDGGNMGQALEAAQMFHMLERESAKGAVDIATPCQLCVNVDRYRGKWLRSAPVQISNHNSWTSPMYHVHAVYSRLRQPNLLRTVAIAMPTVASNSFAGLVMPAVDVVATRGESKSKIVVKAVNNSFHDAQELRVTLEGIKVIKKATVTEIGADSMFVQNTASAPTSVVPVERQVPTQGATFTYTLPPFAVAAFELECEAA